MYNIRPYKKSDFITLCNWYESAGLHGFRETMVPLETTFVVERDSIPVVSACLYLNGCVDVCTIENLIANPELKGNRTGCVDFIFNHLEQIAKSKGYKTVVLFSYEEKVKNMYENMGFVKTLENVTTYAKEIA